VGLDERQTDENTGNYAESDPGRVGNEARLRQMALWIIANFVDWRLRQRDRTTTQDYYDFLRRARWKAQQSPQWVARVGRYLSVNLEE
jgi:hypothetical protein